MRLSLRVKDEVVASIDLGGPLLLVPHGTVVVANSAEAMLLEVACSGGEQPDLLVGDLPLVWQDRSSRSVRVSFLSVPPPPPFAPDDVLAMWRQLLASWLPPVESVGAQGRAPGAGAIADGSLMPEALPRADAACRRFLGQWPEEESVTWVWRPVDMKGGREDLVATDRRAGARPGLRVTGVMVPDRVARRHRSVAAWRSNRLAAACRALVRAVEEERLPEGVGPLVRPVREIAQRAAGPPGSVDPPWSSWPPIARAAQGAVVEALIALSLAREGSDRVPLSHIWRLYEHWLALVAVETLRESFGPGTKIEGEGSCIWECDVGRVSVRVHAQAQIGAEAVGPDSGQPVGFFSVLSDLHPDVFISVEGEGGKRAALCLEAKRRTAATSMGASEVAGAAAKYVWGIRSAGTPDVPSVGAIVVSSARLEGMHDVSRGRISIAFLLPSDENPEFATSLTQRVKEMVGAVASP